MKMLEWKKVRILNGTKKYVNKIEKVVYYIASFLMPSILLFDLYNRNHTQNHIVFSHVLILAGILAIGGILLFIVFKLLSKSEEGALLLALFSWLGFWLYEPLLRVIRRVFSLLFVPSRVFAILLLLALILLISVLRKYQLPFYKIRPAFNLLAICLIVFFIINLIPGANHEITLVRERERLARMGIEEVINGEYTNLPFYTKQNFEIDFNLPSPDIYWFHMDNVLSLESIEQFWDLSYSHYREKLGERGFFIYEDATVTGGNTAYAWGALLSPAFYDSFLGERLAKIDSELNVGSTRMGFLHNELAQVGLDIYEDIHPNLELFRAFFEREYELCINGVLYCELPISFEHFTDNRYYHTSIWREFQRSALPNLLSLTTPLPMIVYGGVEEDFEAIRHIRGIEPVARFTFYLIYDAHMSMSVQYRVTEPIEGIPNYKRIDLYPFLGFEIAMGRALDRIDEILESNPDAVIILQSDHGFHAPAVQEFLLEEGYSEAKIVELMHSVFSAVRIPERYGGLIEPIAPLNISRELVNRFVGHNYELLPSN